MSRSPTAGNRGQGGNWIRDAKREAIYARDGWRCVWCCNVVGRLKAGDVLGFGVRLATLDHIVARSRGGSNDASNLVTACADCNADRGDESALEYAFRVAGGGPGRKAYAAELLDRVIDAMGRTAATKRRAA